MPWVRIDDHFDEHPKMANIGLVGMGLWLAGLAYCNRNLTDGFIPWTMARRLGSLDVVDDEGRVWGLARTSGMVGDDVTNQWVIDLLLDAGLWHEVAGENGRVTGYRIHDYDEYQPTKEDIEAEREAKRRAGGPSAAARSQQSVEQTVEQTVEHALNGRSNKTPTELNTVPNPVPVPNPDPKRENEPPPPRASAPEILHTAEILTTAPWVGDEFAAVEKAVCRAYGLVSEFNPRDGPFLAEQFVGWRGYRKKPPENWYLAWLKWLKKERDDAKERSNGHSDTPATHGPARTPPATRHGSHRAAIAEDYDAAVRARAAPRGG